MRRATPCITNRHMSAFYGRYLAIGGGGGEGVVSRHVGVQLEQVGDLVAEEGEQERPARQAGDALPGRDGLVDRRDMAVAVAVHVDEMRAEGAVGQLADLAVE